MSIITIVFMDVYGVKVKPTDIGAFGGHIVDIRG